jgi:hypothetical protein
MFYALIVRKLVTEWEKDSKLVNANGYTCITNLKIR